MFWAPIPLFSSYMRECKERNETVPERERERSIPEGGPIELFLVPAIVDPLSYFSFQPLWTHWSNSRTSQCSTTGVTKAVLCGMVHTE